MKYYKKCDYDLFVQIQKDFQGMLFSEKRRTQDSRCSSLAPVWACVGGGAVYHSAQGDFMLKKIVFKC